jgi:prepilin-type N-terminal cleavage/methylation domain-containing protein
MRTSQGGFTIVELVIAIGVLAIVMTVSVMMVRSARSEMRDSVTISDIKQIQAGMELYFAEQYSYPVVAQPIALGVQGSTCLDNNGFSSQCKAERPYMPIVPVNQDGISYVYVSRNNENAACTASPCAKYVLQFSLENARGTLAAGPNCARPEGIKPGACQ